MTYPKNHDDSVAHGQIKAFVERIERLEEEQRAINDDKSEVYKEAKANGFDVKVLRKIIADRRKDASERTEFDALYELYWDAVHGVVRARVETIEEFPSGGEVSRTDEPSGGVEPRGGAPAGSVPEQDESARIAPAQSTSAPIPNTREGDAGEAEPAREVEASPATNVTPIRKQWKQSDPAHPDCLNPSGCGGFSNLARCDRCKEAAAAGQVA